VREVNAEVCMAKAKTLNKKKLNPDTVKRRVRKSLEEQLAAKGADVDLYLDQINDYMDLWDLKESLIKDIKENGLRMMYEGTTGKVEKDNPSPRQLPIVNRQMLAILKQLDISTGNIVKDGAGSDDL
jgi:hypothetical protein